MSGCTISSGNRLAATGSAGWLLATGCLRCSSPPAPPASDAGARAASQAGSREQGTCKTDERHCVTTRSAARSDRSIARRRRAYHRGTGHDCLSPPVPVGGTSAAALLSPSGSTPIVRLCSIRLSRACTRDRSSPVCAPASKASPRDATSRSAVLPRAAGWAVGHSLLQLLLLQVGDGGPGPFASSDPVVGRGPGGRGSCHQQSRGPQRPHGPR